MKFVGHLDLMRYFQKAIRRAGLDIAYSAGYHPHMILSFASPLGIGLTGSAEYLDIGLNTPISSKDAIAALNRNAAEGLQVTGFVKIPEDKASQAMTLVAAADYSLRFRRGHEPAEKWEDLLAAFLDQKNIPVQKKTRNSEKEVDIRPMIYHWSLESGTIFFRLAAGSSANLKPDLVMEAFRAQMLHLDPDPLAFEINRCELYADLGKEGAHNLVSLYDLGEQL